MKTVLFCHNFKEDLYQCCSSCHYDDEGGYVSLGERYFYDDEVCVCGCCGLMKFLDSDEIYDIKRYIKEEDLEWLEDLC